MAKETVLIIDDEKDLIDLVRYNLEQEGYAVLSASDGEKGLALAAEHRPDVILLDLMLPGIDGLEVCRMLRGENRAPRIPVIILSAKGGESDRVVGLELGADDYITKPFSPRELVARVRAVLRRSAPEQEFQEVLREGDLVIDLSRHEVTCRGKPAALTAAEFRLLRFIASRPGRVFSRGEIIDGAFGRDITILDRTIDVHIMALRKKLGRCGAQIETVRGVGYRFREEERSSAAEMNG